MSDGAIEVNEKRVWERSYRKKSMGSDSAQLYLKKQLEAIFLTA